ncbi:O-antigen ligase family protein [Aequorivita sinensis]|uniref:O-antigen ligase family protein n=1 Tax=Aequorivita sinensis TaxID=1382458 RepID=UPI0022FFF696|nr:O-antigen ligase family protein [Aequorivita sinensis]
MVSLKKYFRKAEVDIFTISAFLMAFFLPLHIGISNLFLILFFVASGYYLFLKKQYEVRRPKLLLLTLLPVFLLYIFGLFYSSPPFEGIKIIGRNIAFLLCPLLLFFYNTKDLLRIKKSLFQGIVIGAVISILILLVNNFLNYFATRPFPSFDDEIFNYYYTYYSFSNFLDMHPTYLGAYLIFAISLLLKKLLQNRDIKALIISSLIILTVGVIFINSRMIFFLYALVVFSAIMYLGFIFYTQKKIGALSLIIIVTIAVVFSIIKTLSNTYIFTRLTNELQWELTEQVDTSYNDKLVADSRIARWQSTLEAIGEKPIFGYGTHTEKDVLEGYYKKNGLQVSFKNRYDSHNIYLSFMLEYGVFGLSFLLLYLLSNLYISLKNRNVQYFLLIFMVCVIGLFESYLKNNPAITFVAFFGSVFLFSSFPEKLKKEE